jgi:hypothetical protein
MADGGEFSLTEQSSYLSPTKQCDLVMKDSDTRLVHRLAKNKHGK